MRRPYWRIRWGSILPRTITGSMAGRIRSMAESSMARAIELTRFPVPADGDHDDTDTEPGLVRAADLIGQLADPLYLRRINALYHEFVESGMAERCGYTSPADMVDKYPTFFWKAVEP